MLKKTIAALLSALCLSATLPPAGAAAADQVTNPSGAAGQEEADPEAGEISRRYLESMDTLITLTAYGSERETALDQAEEEIRRLDNLLSTGKEDSEISLLNRAGSGTLSADAQAIVEKALALYESTGGLFDITIYPLMQLWGFSTGDYHVPTEPEISRVLKKVGCSQLLYDKASHILTLGEGQAIDLGGIAKGYASARVMDVFSQAGVSSGLVSLGGNVQCLNRKPDGSDYVIAIRDPFGSEADYAATLKIHNESVITSGGYERYFTDEASGKTYQHIMDPKTGYPVENDLASVSIVTTDGMLGDGLSTSLYAMGLYGAQDYWRAHSTEFQIILISQEGKLYISEGLTGRMITPAAYEVVSVS